jgi:hypothetical protein
MQEAGSQLQNSSLVGRGDIGSLLFSDNVLFCLCSGLVPALIHPSHQMVMSCAIVSINQGDLRPTWECKVAPACPRLLFSLSLNKAVVIEATYD